MISRTQMIQLAQGQLDAYNKRDIEKFCTFYHSEVEAWLIDGQTHQKKLICRGIKEFKEMYGKRFETTPDLFCELKHRTVTQFSVIDEELVIFHKEEPQMHAVALYHFKDNLIYCIHFTK